MQARWLACQGACSELGVAEHELESLERQPDARLKNCPRQANRCPIEIRCELHMSF